MKIVIAIDSFKESLTSLQAGTAVQEGIKRIFQNSQIFAVNLSGFFRK